MGKLLDIARKAIKQEQHIYKEKTSKKESIPSPAAEKVIATTLTTLTTEIEKQPEGLSPEFEQAAARAYRSMLNAGYSVKRARSALQVFVPRNDTQAAYNLLEAVNAGGDLDTVALLRWFRYVQKMELLPYEPFDLGDRRVDDPIGFYMAIEESIQAGPESPWAVAILEDLSLLAAAANQHRHPLPAVV